MAWRCLDLRLKRCENLAAISSVLGARKDVIRLNLGGSFCLRIVLLFAPG